jgi:hypothetical protein
MHESFVHRRSLKSFNSILVILHGKFFSAKERVICPTNSCASRSKQLQSLYPYYVIKRLNIFSDTSAYFGFLDFIHSADGDKKVNEVDKNIRDDEKNDRLSTVSHFNLLTSFVHQLHNQWSS